MKRPKSTLPVNFFSKHIDDVIIFNQTPLLLYEAIAIHRTKQERAHSKAESHLIKAHSGVLESISASCARSRCFSKCTKANCSCECHKKSGR